MRAHERRLGVHLDPVSHLVRQHARDLVGAVRLGDEPAREHDLLARNRERIHEAPVDDDDLEFFCPCGAGEARRQAIERGEPVAVAWQTFLPSVMERTTSAPSVARARSGRSLATARAGDRSSHAMRGADGGDAGRGPDPGSRMPPADGARRELGRVSRKRAREGRLGHEQRGARLI